jgi:sugar phosphate isomerase/epimerase
MPRWPITLIADEAYDTAQEQIEFVRSEGLDGLDLRNANGRNVLDLTEADLAELEVAHIECLASPINKVAWSEDGAEGELEKLRRACGLAHRLGTKRIRIFTPEAESWEQVKAWMEPQVRLAEAEGVILLHENDARYWGAYPENARQLFAEFGSPHFRAAFDFANTVLIGFRPWDDWFPWILPHLDTIHIKDALEAEGRVTPAGEGDGQVVRTLAWLGEQGWSGPLTLEPHLRHAGPMSGDSGPELCRVAHQALLRCLEEAGL